LTTQILPDLIDRMNALPVNFLLVLAEKPKATIENKPDDMWQNFLTNIRTKMPPPEGTKTHHDNIWLIPVFAGMIWLAKINPSALHYDIPLQVLFFEHGTDWLND
jgi:hypothetical protein